MQNLKAKPFIFEGIVKGQFEKNMLPTSEMLKLKIGARVMFLNNDPAGRWINGTLGTIIEFEKEEDEDGETTLVNVQIDDGPIVSVDQFTWTNYKTTYNEGEKAQNGKPWLIHPNSTKACLGSHNPQITR